MQDAKNTYLWFNKRLSCTQVKRTSNAIWIKLTRMNRNWTGKLTLLFALFPERNRAPSHISKASSEEVIVPYSGKMKAKYSNEDVWMSFLFVNLQVGIAQLHYRLTYSQIFFQRFWVNERFRIATSCSCITCLKNICEILCSCIWWLKSCNLYVK